MKSIYTKQQQVVHQIQAKYMEQQYTFKHPFICLDPFGLTPLAALVKFQMEAVETFEISIADYSYRVPGEEEEQTLQIVGLYADCINEVTIKAYLKNQTIKETMITIKTQPLPEAFSYLNVVTYDENNASDGFISMCLARADGSRPFGNMYSMMDRKGNIRWYYLGKSWYIFKVLKNGNLIVDSPVSEGEYEKYSPTGAVEMDYVGQYKDFFPMPNGSHHDIWEMENGNIIALTQHEHTVEDVVIEIDRKTKEIVKTIDFNHILDSTRPTVIDKQVINDERDWLHLNSISYSEAEDALVVSSRNQSLVVKIDYQTFKIKWILGPHDHWKKDYQSYLLKPVGDDFEWSWSGHTAIANGSQVLVFDNGNYRSFDFKEATLASSNYSRGVEYRIDEEKMEVKQVWQYGKERGSTLHCPFLSGVSLLENDNRLMCFGGTAKDRFGNAVDDMKSPRVKNRVYIVETTKESDVVFEVQWIDEDIMNSQGFLCYRAGEIKPFK